MVTFQRYRFFYAFRKCNKNHFCYVWVWELFCFNVNYGPFILGPAVVDQLLRELAEKVTGLEEKYKTLLHGSHVCI